MAVEERPEASAAAPTAVALTSAALAAFPTPVLSSPKPMLFAPNADALSPVASALFPTAVDPSPETVLDPVPQANSCFAAFSTHPAAAAGAVTVCAAPSTGNSVIAPAAQLVINATR